jgi:hypothetical protein
MFDSGTDNDDYLSTITVDLSDIYTISSSITSQSQQSGRVVLTGSEADLVINGVSLSATLQGIQERLNILTVDPALEAKWDQLRALGKQYRTLEAELLEKQRMWETLQR